MKLLTAFSLSVLMLTQTASATSLDEAAAAPPPGTTNPDAPAAPGTEAAGVVPPGPVASAILAILDRGSAGKRAVKGQPEAEFAATDGQVLEDFYRDREGAPVWTDDAGVSERGRALAAEIAAAAAYGLDPRAFALPAISNLSGAEALAAAELSLSRTLLEYARHARGGRIPRPAEQLNSNLDRKPQMLAPETVLAAVASANDVTTAVRALHPVHQQFERLRLAYLEEKAAAPDGRLSGKAKQLRANMEMWRWMWDDLGELHIFNNIPEFMQRVVHKGAVVRNERIVVGEISKQSSVFSRQLKSVVLRPRWRVPESIMVHELWPSLLKGGGLMRKHGLEITTKSGQPRDWRRIDWSKDDIRNYHVVQPPGPGSAVGVVKFSFPSQHTIFMHDTPDKWMFNAQQRTLSHGCLRVRNPLSLAEIVLTYDKGLSRAEIDKLVRSGPPDNEIEIEKRLPVHLAYFTAWVDDDGTVRTFRDIYGHEKRVTQALDGDWKLINKGRDHLAPPKPRFKPTVVASEGPARPTKRQRTTGRMISDALGGRN